MRLRIDPESRRSWSAGPDRTGTATPRRPIRRSPGRRPTASGSGSGRVRPAHAPGCRRATPSCRPGSKRHAGHRRRERHRQRVRVVGEHVPRPPRQAVAAVLGDQRVTLGQESGLPLVVRARDIGLVGCRGWGDFRWGDHSCARAGSAGCGGGVGWGPQLMCGDVRVSGGLALARAR